MTTFRAPPGFGKGKLGGKFLEQGKNAEAAIAVYDPLSRIWVGGLPMGITDMMLAHEFNRCGKVLSTMIKRGGKGKGPPFGFIQFSSQDEAKTAIRRMDQNRCFGNPIKVCGCTGDESKVDRKGATVHVDPNNPIDPRCGRHYGALDTVHNQHGGAVTTEAGEVPSQRRTAPPPADRDRADSRDREPAKKPPPRDSSRSRDRGRKNDSRPRAGRGRRDDRSNDRRGGRANRSRSRSRDRSRGRSRGRRDRSRSRSRSRDRRPKSTSRSRSRGGAAHRGSRDTKQGDYNVILENLPTDMEWSELRILGNQYCTYKESGCTFSKIFDSAKEGKGDWADIRVGQLEFVDERDADALVAKLNNKRIAGHDQRLQVYRMTKEEIRNLAKGRGKGGY
ncbi:unnamed protein product [Amoebophrya sp. A120]|nr:unnamed protein product [Amoebophrya sp. A120]|eukprot:GSA120T00020290001.1